MPDTPAIGATVLGYPRIGPDRQLKRAVEAFWSGTIDVTELQARAETLRAGTWRELVGAGLDSVPGNTFSLYDQVLDTAWMLGAVPERFTALGLPPLDTYFTAARGAGDVPALEMTKWFDTNYHYLVPELGPDTAFTLDPAKPLGEYRQARRLGIETRPVVVGPLSFLLLSKPHAGAPDGFRTLDLLDAVVDAYAELLAALAAEGVGWVQLDEPCLAQDRTAADLEALAVAYDRLTAAPLRPRILVATYFGDPAAALPVLAASAVEAVAVDLVTGPLSTLGEAAAGLATKTVVAGVVDGRNVWRTDLEAALQKLVPLMGVAGDVAPATSCSLLHVPYDVDAETNLDPEVRSWLAFARQKLGEVVTLRRALTEGREAVTTELAHAEYLAHQRRRSPRLRNEEVRHRLDAIGPDQRRRGEYTERRRHQQALNLPDLASTTIGSFPQTGEVRQARAAHSAGRLSAEGYTTAMRAEIERVVRLQESLGLDVLVHGEPERNDMVQFFAEQLDGYAATEHGWVQSYGSRGVRPPILFGDISRPAPMTVAWSAYAQSLTAKPVKGMLTGPVTMLAWSFVRDDQPLADTAQQVALAIRDETVDLEDAGLGVIQVDEPALRELLPLREADRTAYLEWAVAAFRMATSGVSDAVQVHTHMCYGDFGDIIDAIEAMDIDVISLEASRSQMEILDELAGGGFTRAVGPGVYDVHSPRVPTVEEVSGLLVKARAAVGAGRLWVNPDCGLKTRAYAEVEPALRNLVTAAAAVRAAGP